MAKRRRNRSNQLNKNFTSGARAAGAKVTSVSPEQMKLISGQTLSAAGYGGQFAAMPRTDPMVPFGPGVPLLPAEIDPLTATGRVEPRQWQYPITWNLPGFGERYVPWETLVAASRVDIVHDCIKVIKTELTGLRWAITVSEVAISDAMETAGIRKVEAKQALRERLQSDITRAREFWQNPDVENGRDFTSWFWQAIDEVLVLDALAIYPCMTYGGRAFSLRILDGSSIKPLIDHRGVRPAAPQPAFQQILHGFPRGEFTASIGVDGSIEGSYASDELLYYRREVRSRSPYGFSPVEAALSRVNLWLKRLDMMTQEFDASALPMALLELPADAHITPQDMIRWREAINALLSGNLAERQRIQIGVPGGKLTKFADNAELYKPHYDTFIVKLICASFGVTPAEIGFIENGGLGGSSYHEGQENIQYRKMIMPWSNWFANIFNMINRRYLGIDPAIEFRFLGLEEEDEAAADAVLMTRVQSGRMTINEARDLQGQAPFDMEEADEPYVLSRMGPTFLRGLKEQQDAQGLAQKAGAQAAVQALDPGQEAAEADREDQADEKTANDEEGSKPASKPAPKSGKSTGTDVSKAAELDQFARWAGKVATTGRNPRRPFAFTTVDNRTARQLNTLVLDDAAQEAATLAKTEAATLRKSGGDGSAGRPHGPPQPRAGHVAGVPGTRRARAEVLPAGLPGCPATY